MERPGLRDLVGRAMVDEEFRESLIKDPSSVLAEFDLEGEERAAIMKAAAQSRGRPHREQARAFQAVMMKRWAT